MLSINNFCLFAEKCAEFSEKCVKHSKCKTGSGRGYLQHYNALCSGNMHLLVFIAVLFLLFNNNNIQMTRKPEKI